jgi:hypothetical protein
MTASLMGNAVKWPVLIAAVEAGATGLVLMISPPLFGRLIFAAELSEAGQALGRLAGMALVGFAMATWTAPPAAIQPAMRSLLIYNLLATIYLGYLGVAGQLVGILLWPAVVLHAVLLILLGRAKLVASKGDYLAKAQTGG